MSDQAQTIDDFLARTASGGSAIGLLVDDRSARPAELPGVQVRRIDGGDARSLPAFYRAMAAAWEFPAHFGMNKDAFDDCMGDLPDAERGYLTEITDPAALLGRARGQLRWLVESIAFYADEYAPRQQFGVLLLSPADEVVETFRVWTAAGANVVRVR